MPSLSKESTAHPVEKKPFDGYVLALQALIGFGILNILAMFVFFFVGIWTDDGRWGMSGIICLLLTIAVGFTIACVYDDYKHKRRRR